MHCHRRRRLTRIPPRPEHNSLGPALPEYLQSPLQGVPLLSGATAAAARVYPHPSAPLPPSSEALHRRRSLPPPAQRPHLPGKRHRPLPSREAGPAAGGGYRRFGRPGPATPSESVKHGAHEKRVAAGGRPHEPFPCSTLLVRAGSEKVKRSGEAGVVCTIAAHAVAENEDLAVVGAAAGTEAWIVFCRLLPFLG